MSNTITFLQMFFKDGTCSERICPIDCNPDDENDPALINCVRHLLQTCNQSIGVVVMNGNGRIVTRMVENVVIDKVR